MLLVVVVVRCVLLLFGVVDCVMCAVLCCIYCVLSVVVVVSCCYCFLIVVVGFNVSVSVVGCL